MNNPRLAKYRSRLPQLDGRIFLTDGGLETTLMFHHGWDLPIGEAFVLLDSEKGQAELRGYFERYIPLALECKAGFVLESPTWRANPDWAAKAGYDQVRLAANNARAIEFMMALRRAHETPASPMPISGCVGPRGDGYDPGVLMSPEEAERYHSWQIEIFRDAGADFVSAITMTNINEALGFTRAARAARMPAVVSFTVETDGTIPTGETLGEAIEAVDAGTQGWPVYYMINCAHPTHFMDVLDETAAWTRRLRGLRANSSKCSHAELDNAPELDIGNPQELGEEYAEIRRRFPQINVLGGCCGTDHRHVASISHACLKAA